MIAPSPRRLIRLRCPVCGGTLLALVAPGPPAVVSRAQRGCGHRVSVEEDRALREAAVGRVERRERK